MNEDQVRTVLEAYVSTIYVGPKQMRAQLRECERIWASDVAAENRGSGLHGEIRDYNLQPEPMVSGDQRDTWSLCAVDAEGRVVGYDYFSPWGDDEFWIDSLNDLAHEVAGGHMTLAVAKSTLKHDFDNQAPNDLGGWLDAGAYSLSELRRPKGSG